MLKFLFRAFLFRTLFRRFWLLGILYAVGRRFLPWERRQTAGAQPRPRGWR